jgi:DNA repair exonuclease SbcCD ATPase subunit
MNTDTPRTDAEHKIFPMGGFTLDFVRQLESELTAARAEIEEYKNAFTEMNQALGVEVEEVERLKLELTALTEQRDGLKQAVDCASDLLASITEQRERLAEALRQMWPFIEEDDYPSCNTPAFNAAILKYKQAFRSLTTNTNVDARRDKTPNLSDG